jgi:hypothetical protein
MQSQETWVVSGENEAHFQIEIPAVVLGEEVA